MHRHQAMAGNDRSTLQPYCETQLGKLYHADVLDFLRYMKQQGTVAKIVFADPPYNIGKAEWDRFEQDQYLSWVAEWARAAEEILSDSGSLFIMGFSEILADVKYLVSRQCRTFSTCRWLVWHYRNKPNLGSKDWVRSHESILHFRKPSSTFNADNIREPYNVHTMKYPGRKQGATAKFGNESYKDFVWKPNGKGAKPRDVMILPVICNGTPERTTHPTQKPADLMRRLILSSTEEGDLVCDPFGGSGTTFVASEQLRRRWVGSEIEEAYCKMAKERLSTISVRDPTHWIKFDARRERHRQTVRGDLLAYTT